MQKLPQASATVVAATDSTPATASAGSPSGARRWYHRWQVWIFCALVFVLASPVLLWCGINLDCRWQYARTLFKLQAAGFSISEEQYAEECRRNWLAERERSQQPALRCATTRLALFGGRVASLRMPQQPVTLDSLVRPDGYEELNPETWDLNNLQLVRHAASAHRLAAQNLADLRSRFVDWAVGKERNDVTEVLVSQFGYRVAVADRWCLMMDIFIGKLPPGYVSLPEVSDLYALFFLSQHDPGRAVDAWLDVVPGRMRLVRPDRYLGIDHLDALAMAVRSGLLREEHYHRLRAAAIAITANDIRHAVRRELRCQIARLAVYTSVYPEFAWDEIQKTVLFVWDNPAGYVHRNLHDLMPAQIGRLCTGALLLELKAYEEQLAAEDGQPGISLPRTWTENYLERYDFGRDGAIIAMQHNMKLAILAYGLWHVRNPGHGYPASLDDFLDAETRAAFVSVPGVTLEFEAQRRYDRGLLKWKVDPDIAPTLKEFKSEVLIYWPADDAAPMMKPL